MTLCELYCHACRHVLNSEDDSFLGEEQDGMEWHYRCAVCGTQSWFSLVYPLPVRVS